jgi:Protein of unknown function (DUF3592)
MMNVSGLPTLFVIIFVVVGLGVGGAGLFAIVRGALDLSRSRRLRENGTRTSGTVVDNQIESHRTAGQPGTAGRPGTASRTWFTFRPAVRFRTMDGREITAIGPASSNRSFVAGTTVELIYDPENPTRIELTEGQGRGSGGAAKLVGGAVAVVFAMIFLIVTSAMSQVTSSIFGSDPAGSDCAQTIVVDGQELCVEQ